MLRGGALEERATFLDDACAGDEFLRKQVEVLLAAHDEAGSFIESPAMEVQARGLADQESVDTAIGYPENGKPLPNHLANWRRRHGRRVSGTSHLTGPQMLESLMGYMVWPGRRTGKYFVFLGLATTPSAKSRDIARLFISGIILQESLR